MGKVSALRYYMNSINAQKTLNPQETSVIAIHGFHNLIPPLSVMLFPVWIK